MGGMESPMMDAPMAAPMGDSSFKGGGMESENDMNMMPPMDNGGMPPMDGGQQNPYDTNFDAGVEANEETDPKKYIQQLTGKLSQSLRKYSENLPQPDADLNKYVAGMIVKQCVDGLNPEDAQDILDKVNSDENAQGDNPNGDMQMPPMDGGNQDMAAPDMNGGMQPPMNESMNARIDNLFNRFTDDDNEPLNDVNIKHRTYGNSPYTGKSFKKKEE